jgi:hypothetical protein
MYLLDEIHIYKYCKKYGKIFYNMFVHFLYIYSEQWQRDVIQRGHMWPAIEKIKFWTPTTCT